MKRRLGSNSSTLICSCHKTRAGRGGAERSTSTKLCIHNNATSDAAVLNVPHKPHRYAAAASTKKKNKKKGLRPPAKIEMKAGHTISARRTMKRNAAVDWRLRRSKVITSTP